MKNDVFGAPATFIMSFIPFPALDFHNLNDLCLSFPTHIRQVKKIKIIVGMGKKKAFSYTVVGI